MWDDLKGCLGSVVLGVILLIAAGVWLLIKLLPLLLFAGAMFLVLLGLGLYFNYQGRVRAYHRLKREYKKRESRVDDLDSKVTVLTLTATASELQTIALKRQKLLTKL